MGVRRGYHSGAKVSRRMAGLTRSTFLTMLSFLCFLTAAPISQAQVQNGTITGSITDPAGAAISDASVTLTGQATGLILHTQSSREGIYTFPQLIPGEYTLTVERQGFEKATSTITLTVGQTANFNIPLSLGNETQTVSVNGENAGALDTETSNLDYTVQSRQVDTLPLNGRNP